MARKARFSTTLAPGSNGGRSPRHAGTHGKESEAGWRSKGIKGPGKMEVRFLYPPYLGDFGWPALRRWTREGM